jgi:hypothetical protein
MRHIACGLGLAALSLLSACGGHHLPAGNPPPDPQLSPTPAVPEGQAPQWSHTWRSGGADRITALTGLPSGAVLAAGYSQLYPAAPDGTAVDYGLALLYSADGAPQSARWWPTAAFAGAGATAGGAYLFGNLEDQASGRLTPLVVKLGPDGSQQWTRTWALDPADGAYCTGGVADAAGGIYLVLAHNMTDYPYTATTYLLQYDASGQLTLQESVAADGGQQIEAAALSGANLLLAGHLPSGAPDAFGHGTGERALLASFTPGGSFAWAREWQGADDFDLHWTGVAAAPDGGCYLAGVREQTFLPLVVGAVAQTYGVAGRIGVDGSVAWVQEYSAPAGAATPQARFSGVFPVDQGGFEAFGAQTSSAGQSGGLLAYWTPQGELLSSQVLGAAFACAAFNGSALRLAGGVADAPAVQVTDPGGSANSARVTTTALGLSVTPLAGVSRDAAASVQPIAATGTADPPGAVATEFESEAAVVSF